MVRLTLCELIEAGLFDLFVTLFKKVINQPSSPLKDLHYFGDTHVQLEMNHTVTFWFSGKESDVAHLEVSTHLYPILMQIVKEVMEHFKEMYLAFDKIISAGMPIKPEKYNLTNLPPIN